MARSPLNRKGLSLGHYLRVRHFEGAAGAVFAASDPWETRVGRAMCKHCYVVLPVAVAESSP